MLYVTPPADEKPSRKGRRKQIFEHRIFPNNTFNQKWSGRTAQSQNDLLSRFIMVVSISQPASNPPVLDIIKPTAVLKVGLCKKWFCTAEMCCLEKWWTLWHSSTNIFGVRKNGIILVSPKSLDYIDHSTQQWNISQDMLLVCDWKQPEKRQRQAATAAR